MKYFEFGQEHPELMVMPPWRRMLLRRTAGGGGNGKDLWQSLEAECGDYLQGGEKP